MALTIKPPLVCSLFTNSSSMELTPHNSSSQKKPHAALMSSTPVQENGNCHACLSMMPPELITNVFCQLPSFPDVFTLSTVCHRLRHVWLENVTSIYNAIAPRSIPCESAARRFLVDQVGLGLDSPMSARDVVCMVRNADIVENAILQFEREVVSRVRSKWICC